MAGTIGIKNSHGFESKSLPELGWHEVEFHKWLAIKPVGAGGDLGLELLGVSLGGGSQDMGSRHASGFLISRGTGQPLGSSGTGSGAPVLLDVMRLAHSESRGFRAIPGAYLIVNIGDVTLHRALAEHQRLGYLTIGLALREEA